MPHLAMFLGKYRADRWVLLTIIPYLINYLDRKSSQRASVETLCCKYIFENIYSCAQVPEHTRASFHEAWIALAIPKTLEVKGGCLHGSRVIFCKAYSMTDEHKFIGMFRPVISIHDYNDAWCIRGSYSKSSTKTGMFEDIGSTEVIFGIRTKHCAYKTPPSKN